MGTVRIPRPRRPTPGLRRRRAQPAEQTPGRRIHPWAPAELGRNPATGQDRATRCAQRHLGHPSAPPLPAIHPPVPDPADRHPQPQRWPTTCDCRTTARPYRRRGQQLCQPRTAGTRTPAPEVAAQRHQRKRRAIPATEPGRRDGRRLRLDRLGHAPTQSQRTAHQRHDAL